MKTTNELHNIYESKNYFSYYKPEDSHTKKLITVARFETNKLPLTNDLDVLDSILTPTRPKHMSFQDDLDNIKLIAQNINPFITLPERKPRQKSEKQMLADTMRRFPKYKKQLTNIIKYSNFEEYL
jgi:hypothetical protein